MIFCWKLGTEFQLFVQKNRVLRRISEPKSNARSFRIYILDVILGFLVQGGWDRSTCSVHWGNENFIHFGTETSNENSTLGGIGVCTRIMLNYVEGEVLTAVVMRSSFFWDLTPCSPLNVNRRFGGTWTGSIWLRIGTSRGLLWTR
jgi:hypothetical protein